MLNLGHSGRCCWGWRGSWLGWWFREGGKERGVFFVWERHRCGEEIGEKAGADGFCWVIKEYTNEGMR